MNLKGLAVIMCVAAGVVSLSAQEVDAGVRSILGMPNSPAIGIQAFVVSPQQDLRTTVGGRTGFAVGAHWAFALDDALEMRPRIDYTRLDGGSFSFNSVSSTTTVQGVSIGADVIRYQDESQRGLYGMLGANLCWWSVKNTFLGNTTTTAPTVLFGVGNRFSQSLSAEIEVDYGKFRAGDGRASSIRLGAFYKF